MKQRLNRILALLLVCLTLLTGVMPAFAAEETVEPFAYEGAAVSFIKADGSNFGMFAAQEGTTCVINGDNVVIHYVPKTTTVYTAFHWGSIDDTELNADVSLSGDGAFDITLPKEKCGWAIPVAPLKPTGETTSAQEYLAIPAVDKLEDVTPAPAVEPFPYDGDVVNFIKEDGEGFGMFTAQEGTTCVINGDNVVIHYVPKTTTVYTAFHWGSIDDAELTANVSLSGDGAFDITLPKEKCGWAIPVAPLKPTGETTSAQEYLAIPAVDKLEDVTPAPAVEPFPYDGDVVNFIKEDGEGFGMFTAQEGTTCVINGDNVVIHYVPRNTTVYGWLHFGGIADAELTKDVTFNADGTFDITLSKDKCGWALPVAPIKVKDGGTSSSQYYLAIPAEEKLEDVTPAEPVEPDADYSAVDAALAKIPVDLSPYTEESVKALMDARDAVVRGLKQSEQERVDAMAQAIEDAIAALVLKPVDGRVDLEIINTTGMFKALFAYVVTENGKSTLVVALTGSTYHYLYKGNYAQAVANGDNRDNWVKGYQNEAGKWLFDFPLTEGETYIPAVSISSTYLEKYEKGENPLERSFYPRQFVLDLDAKTLTVGDYDETVTASVKSEVESFRVAETAQMRVVGGPNSNNFRVAPVLQMLDDTYDQVMYNTVENGKLTTTSAALGADNTFTIDILNAPNLFAFKDKEPLPLRLRDKATGETSTVWMTIDMLARTITISGEGQPQQEDHIYQFVAGGDGTWTKGSDDPMLLTVKSNTDDEGTFSRFVGVEVDGKELDKANYEATAGSVNIALKADYLNTLSEGKHTVTVKMTDGSVSTTLTIAAAGTEQPGDGGAPDTGDADVFVWMGLMITSAAALAVMLCEKKRRTVR